MMKIAIIGNGKLSKNYGKDIDSYDIVIRFNKAKTKGYEDIVGSKTDILALVCETQLSYNLAYQKLDQCLIRETRNIWFSGKKRNEKYEDLLLNAVFPLNIYFKYINYDVYNLISSNVNSNKNNKFPSTGINILCYVYYNYILYSSNKLNVYGFDQFKSGHYFDDEQRNNHEFHDLETERKIIEYLKDYDNINFFN